MIVFTADCDRDLKREEAAASMARPAGAGAGAGKKKEAGASERRVPLARLLPNDSTAEAGPAGAGKKRKEATAEKMEEATAEKKMKEAVASESGDSLFKEGEMLKLWEEYWDAVLLWRDRHVKGALTSWLKRKKTTQVPAVAGKKKKVVRVILPDDYIDYISQNSCRMTQLSGEAMADRMRDLSGEEMAKCIEEYRQSYAIAKILDAKKHAYQQALINQHRAFGYAYDEKEVTDEDQKKVTGVVQ